MFHTALLDFRFVEFLVRTDEKMAEEVRSARCLREETQKSLEGRQFCMLKAQQHGRQRRFLVNSFPRKPRGMPPEWTEHITYRLSFDCSVCSKQGTLTYRASAA